MFWSNPPKPLISTEKSRRRGSMGCHWIHREGNYLASYSLSVTLFLFPSLFFLFFSISLLYICCYIKSILLTLTYGLVCTSIQEEASLNKSNNQIITGTHCVAFSRLSCRNEPLGKCCWCGQVGGINYLIGFVQRIWRSHDENITSSIKHSWPYRF